MAEAVPSNHRALRALGLGVLVSSLLIAASWSGWADRNAQDQAEAMLTRALVTFAVARSLNGIISVIQETEVAIQPAGVGVKLAPGQILDPVNDLVEQFSWVMLVSAASLGIQRLLLEISQWPGMTLLLAGCAVLWLLALANRSRPAWRVWFGRAFLLAIFLRFAVPAVMLASDAIYQLFLEPVYASASAEIGQTQNELTQLHEQASAEAEEGDSDGLLGWWGRTSDQFRWTERIERYQALFARLAENVVQLVAVFVLQTILLPLLFLWVLIRIWRQFLRLTSV